MSEEEKNIIESTKKYFNSKLDVGDKFILGKIYQIIDKQQKEIKHQRQQRKYWRDNFYKQQKEIEVLREENFDTIYMKAVADFKDKIREILKKYSEKEECTYKELIDFVEEIKELLEEK